MDSVRPPSLQDVCTHINLSKCLFKFREIVFGQVPGLDLNLLTWGVCGRNPGVSQKSRRTGIDSAHLTWSVPLPLPDFPKSSQELRVVTFSALIIHIPA